MDITAVRASVEREKSIVVKRNRSASAKNLFTTADKGSVRASAHVHKKPKY